MFVMTENVFVMGWGNTNLHEIYVNGVKVAETWMAYSTSNRTVNGLTKAYFGGSPTRITPKCFVRDVRISNIARDASYGLAAAAALTT